MGKRKQGKRRTISPRREPRAGHRAAEELEKALERVDHVIDRGRPQETMELLEPLVSRHSHVADVHYTLGYARVKAGDPWQALASYERAQELGRETDYFLPLASLYLQVGLHIHALRAFRQVLRQGKDRSPEAQMQTALEIQPDYEPAKNLLEHLGLLTRLQKGWGDFFAHQQERERAKRARLQARLTTPDPTLSRALSLYTKDALTGIARIVLPWGGWSTLRKAELVQEIVTGLQDAESLEHLVADLGDEERDALRRVLKSGGSKAWEAFEARYGNDLEESAYWNYHVPETIMGRLRLHGVLVEATVEGQLRVAIPAELRPTLKDILV